MDSSQRKPDNYKRLRDLGEGGFGTVYLAEEISSGQKVAIKQVRADKADTDFADLFKQEVNIQYELDHPHIVKLIYGNLSERYLVMEFMAGGNLRNEMRSYPRNQMPVRRSLAVIDQVLDALEYIHKKSLVHRDIKPANLLMDESRQMIKLGDFGAVWNTSRASRPEWSQIGDSDYKSPEQVERKRELDARSDLYSLGLVLYEMLTAERPFGPGKARLTTPLPDIRKLRPDLPKPVVLLIQKSLALHPDDRYDSATAMRAAVQVALKVADDRLPQASKKPRSARLNSSENPRRRLVPITVGGVVVLLVAGAAFALWKSFPATSTPAPTVSAVTSVPAVKVNNPVETKPAATVAVAASTVPEQPTPTLRPVATRVPTQTPEPTATPIPPTETPIPSPTLDLDATANVKKIAQRAAAATAAARAPKIVPTPVPPPTEPPPPPTAVPPPPEVTAGRGACPFARGNVVMVASRPNGYFCVLWDGKNNSNFWIKSEGLPSFEYACLDKGDGAKLRGDLPAKFEYGPIPAYDQQVVRVRVVPPGGTHNCDPQPGGYDEIVILRLDWGRY